jgi:hypothetical protein
MKSRLLLPLVATFAFCFLCGAPNATFAKDPPQATSIVTVYVRGSSGSGIAEDMNKMHAKMEQQGWKFAAMALHHEDGDVQGMWVTYTK